MKRCIACDNTFNAETWTCPECGATPHSQEGFLCFAPEIASNSTEYDPKHFQLLSRLEDNSFWFQTRNQLIGWALKQFFPGAANILEVGAGTGFVLRSIHEVFPNADLCGSDAHVEGLRFAAKRLEHRVNLMQMDARRIPFRDHFDVACAFDVLEHIREDKLVLNEIRLCLRQNGGAVITVPQHMFLWGPADEAALHQRRYERFELVEKLQAVGFEVLFKTSFVSLLLPALYVSRWRSRWVGKYRLEDELSVHPVLDALFHGVSRAEVKLIRAGLKMPVGGSQLLVAARRT